MFEEFLTYYFIHNESIVLPALMLYVLAGTGAGLLMVAFEGVVHFFLGDDGLGSDMPSFLRFVAFWWPWLMLGFIEFICKKWVWRYYTLVCHMNNKMSDWMLKE